MRIEQNKRRKTLSTLGIFLMAMSVISFLLFYLIVMVSQKSYTYIDPDTLHLVQADPIEEGTPTAIVTTSMGEIRVVLYPDEAPETVAQFIRLAKAGAYDGTYVFEAKNDVYFAAGAGDKTGALAKGVTDAFEHVPRETHQDLWPFRGALCALETEASSSFFERLFQSQAHTTGSRFMLLGSVDFTDEEFLTQFREASGSEVLADAFIERGGVPNFSQQLTVFGQTYAGLDVVDAICAAPLLEMENVGGYTPPKEDILIESVVISSYGEEDAALNELP